MLTQQDQSFLQISQLLLYGAQKNKAHDRAHKSPAPRAPNSSPAVSKLTPIKQRTAAIIA